MSVTTILYSPIFNFHNQPPIVLRIKGELDKDKIVLSNSQAKRIKKHFCGISDCHCNGGQLEEISPGIFAIENNRSRIDII
jgi:hypothetical protein